MDANYEYNAPQFGTQQFECDLNTTHPTFDIESDPICVPTPLHRNKLVKKTKKAHRDKFIKESEKSKNRDKDGRKHKKSRRNEDDENDPDYDPEASDSEDDTKGFFFGGGSRDVYAEGNHIYFHTGVTKQSINKLTDLIGAKNQEYKELTESKLVDKCSPAPLYLHIASYGGSVLEGFKAISHIQNSALPVYTIVDGYAASAGTMMSVAGKKRYMTEHGYMLIHEISTGMHGKYKELEDGMENAKRWMEDIERLYETRTNIRRKELKKYMKHDYWWNYEKCKELGLVDDVWRGTVAT